MANSKRINYKLIKSLSIIINIVLILFSFIISITRVDSSKVIVPIQYSSLRGIILTSSWWQFYLLPIVQLILISLMLLLVRNMKFNKIKSISYLTVIVFVNIYITAIIYRLTTQI